LADKSLQPAQPAPETLGRTEGLSRPGIDSDTAQGVQEALTAQIPQAGQVSVAPGEPAPPGPFMGGRGAAVPQVTRSREKGGEHLVRHYSRDPEAFPKPTGREEAWRFTPLKRLRGLLDGPEAGAKLSVDVEAPEGVTVERVGAGDPRIASAFTPSDRVAAFALVRSDGATVVSVPKNTDVSAPVVLRLHGEGREGVAYGHLVVDVAPFATATVVLDHTGSATFAGNAEFAVGDGASLTVISLQDWEDDTVHVATHAARVGRDARFRSITVTLGGDVVRITPTVHYAGSGGDADLHGLFFTSAGQHQEHRIFIDHQQRSCRSRVTYKGALQGDKSHSVWIGDVLIGKDATGTDTYELNRNLLLDDGPRADSVPNLEIETGEVINAGHASATGRFDDEALFYLMARGIPADEARRLVVRGFFAEVIDAIHVPAIRERVGAAVEQELAAAGMGAAL
jgi:Fe-S cluster assembly protein SufD